MLAPLRWIVLAITSLAIVSSEPTISTSPDDITYLCPPDFELVNGQCIGTAALAVFITHYQAHNKSIELCNALNSYPVMIKNSEEQTYWDNLLFGGNTIISLGIVCNDQSKKWMWADGSPFTYKPQGNAESIDNRDAHTTDFYCVSEFEKPSLPEGDCVDYGEADSMCYEISEDAESLSDALNICKHFGYNLASIVSSQENSYVRRMAVARGLVNGLLLGASVSGKSDTFGWLDGSSWNYTNFLPGFPIPSFGDCLVMDTNDVNGKWINVDCAEKFPFACSRRRMK